eukprot:m.154207 g.154207  ORF g.154207 m.154207 type:complete len:206 (-) comp14298_c0_seq12:4166-4783(-)
MESTPLTRSSSNNHNAVTQSPLMFKQPKGAYMAFWVSFIGMMCLAIAWYAAAGLIFASALFIPVIILYLDWTHPRVKTFVIALGISGFIALALASAQFGLLQACARDIDPDLASNVYHTGVQGANPTTQHDQAVGIRHSQSGHRPDTDNASTSTTMSPLPTTTDPKVCPDSKDFFLMTTAVVVVVDMIIFVLSGIEYWSSRQQRF